MPLVEVLGSVEARVAAIAAEPTTTTATAATATARAPTSTATTSSVVPEAPSAPARVEEAPAPARGHDDSDLAARTLARISYPWRTRLPGWEIVFLEARPALRGITLPATKRIEIYVRTSDTAESLARVVAHELGHAADVTLNDALDRSRWRAARGVGPLVPWWPDAAAADFATLGGDFAEAFAAWQTGVASLSAVAGAPTDDQLSLLASLVS
jgi:hypothetical protein